MEERDVRPSQHAQPSLLPTTPQASALPSMHAPHLPATATQQKQHHSQQQHTQHAQSYSHSQQQPQYGVAAPPPPSIAQQQQHPPASQPQQHYYTQQRDIHHVSSQQPTQSQQYDYRPVAAQSNPPSSVSLPPIQHLEGHGSAQQQQPEQPPAGTNSNMNVQPTLPPPVSHSQSQPVEGYHYGTDGPIQHRPHVSEPPGHMQYAYRGPPQAPVYPQPQFAQPHHYPNSTAPYQPPPHNTIMSSPMPNGTAMHYGMPPPQMDPRQMSGGRHKKEIKRRTKTGCLTCRKRRIKCDERHPDCRNCEKSKRQCLGYDPVFKSQPAPPPLQPAPMPGQMDKQAPAYHMGYTYHGSEEMYPPRQSLPTPAPSATQHTPATQHTQLPQQSNGVHESQSGSLVDGASSRRQEPRPGSTAQSEPDQADGRRNAWAAMDQSNRPSFTTEQVTSHAN